MKMGKTSNQFTDSYYQDFVLSCFEEYSMVNKELISEH